MVRIVVGQLKLTYPGVMTVMLKSMVFAMGWKGEM